MEIGFIFSLKKTADIISDNNSESPCDKG